MTTAQSMHEASSPLPAVAGLDQHGQPIYVINLDSSRDRLLRFLSVNSHLHVVRHAAADGRSLDRTALAASGTIAPTLRYGPGALGCALSHIALWRMAVDTGHPITIFEDDAVASFNFSRHTKGVLERAGSNWDLIMWGLIVDPLFAWIDLGFANARLHFYESRYKGQSIDTFQHSDLIPHVLRLRHGFGAFAYSITPRGAQTLLDFCLPLDDRLITFAGAGVTIQNEGIDCLMCGILPRMEAFVCMPPLAITDSRLRSDITEAGR